MNPIRGGKTQNKIKNLFQDRSPPFEKEKQKKKNTKKKKERGMRKCGKSGIGKPGRESLRRSREG